MSVERRWRERIDAQTAQAMHTLYRSGASIERVAEEYGRRPEEVARAFADFGLPFRPAAGTPSPAEDSLPVAEIYQLYEQGASLNQVALQCGLSAPRVKELFRDANLPIRSAFDSRGLSRKKRDELRSARTRASRPRRPRSAAAQANHEAAEQRAREMYARYEEGLTLEKVGREYDLTRERVRQLFKQFDLPTRTPKQVAEQQRAAQLARADEVLAAFRELRDEEAVAERLDLPLSLVREIVRDGVPVWERRQKEGFAKRYSDEELIACLHEASEELGGILTTAAYTDFARKRELPDERPWPTHQTHFLRFGSWRAALASAGLRANEASPIAGQRIFEEGHCIDALRHLQRELGRVPTAADYERFATQSGGAFPSLATVRNRCGSWLDALRKANL